MKSNIPSEILFTKRGLILDSHLIISDLHIGYSDVIDSMTIEDEQEEIIDRLKNVYSSNQIDKLVIAGDIFHEFGSPSKPARELLKRIRRVSSEYGVEFIALKGNHDSNAVSDSKYLVDFKDEYYFTTSYNDSESVVGVIHGHKPPEKDASLYILGHLHPNIRIDGVSWPIYLYGENIYNGSDVLILPAFSSYKDGVIVSKTTHTEIDFPLVSPTEFSELSPIVFDSENDDIRVFPILEKSDEYFNS